MESKTKNQSQPGKQNIIYMPHPLMTNPLPLGFYQNLIPSQIMERPQSFSFDDSKKKNLEKKDDEDLEKKKIKKKEANVKHKTKEAPITNEITSNNERTSPNNESLIYSYIDENDKEKKEYLYSKVI